MLKITGNIGDERYADELIDAQKMIDLVGLSDTFDPIFKQIGHVEVVPVFEKVDAFNQSYTIGSLTVDCKRTFQGTLPNGKVGEFDLTYYKGQSTKMSGGVRYVDYTPKKHTLPPRIIFDKRESWLSNIDFMVFLLFHPAVQSPVRSLSKAVMKFTNPLKVTQDRFKKEQVLALLKNSILTEPAGLLRFRSESLGINPNFNESNQRMAMIDMVNSGTARNLGKIKESFSDKNLAIGIVKAAIREGKINSKEVSATQKEWSGTPSIEGLLTARAGDDAIVILFTIGKEKHQDLLNELSAEVFVKLESKDVSIDIKALSPSAPEDSIEKLIESCIVADALYYDRNSKSIFKCKKDGDEPMYEDVELADWKNFLSEKLKADKKELNSLRMILRHKIK